MKMIRLNKFVHLILTVFCIILVCILIGIKSAKNEYDLKIIKKANGWSYIILRDNKPYIYQEYIPCKEGNNAFESKRSAKCVAKLVLKKLKNHKSPYLTKAELNNVLE